MWPISLLRQNTQLALSVYLILIALFTMLLVQGASLGSSDTTTRLRVTRSWWTSAPAADPQDLYQLHYVAWGRNKQLQVTFGAGQSLIMLPADILATTLIESLPPLKKLDQRMDGRLRIALVAYSLAALVSIVSILLAFHFLQLLGFSPLQATLGALSLLWGTSFLHYVQVLQENNLLLLLTLAAAYGQYAWLINPTKSRWPLVLGFAASGFNLLVRLTTVLDFLAIVFFVGGALCWQLTQQYNASAQSSKPSNAHKSSDQTLNTMNLANHSILNNVLDNLTLNTSWQWRILQYGVSGLVVGALFILLERSYHYYRFGSWTNTYLHIATEQYRQIAPYLPSQYPFQLPFSTGFWGALFSPEKSIFLFDPLLLLTLLLLWSQRRKLQSTIILFALSQLLLLMGYIIFYARYFCWGGDAAWADRFVTTPVQLLAMLALPLMLQCQITNKIWGYLLIAISLFIQFLSVTLSYNLEIIQQTLGQTSCRIALRAYNFFTILQHQPLAHYPVLKPFATLQFLPFQLRDYFPNLFPIALISWLIIALLLLLTLFQLVRQLHLQPSTTITGTCRD